ncbi:MAG TPA: peptide chain release factor N(5)-glutamine methyltransferase [Mycobacteriales bacterium]|nr:peptide chain release factor N(5)-glutamine methyltransferase [Mycobacteriales bacterium]
MTLLEPASLTAKAAMTPPPTTVRPAVRAAAERLADAGVASPDHDARALALHVLGLRRPSDLLLVDAFDDEQLAAFDDLVGRRARREPLQHLTGTVGFRHLELEVGPGVFVPRPETESVVQWAIDALACEGGSAPVVADLCTGSGTIAFALAHEVPGITVHAVERDPGALAWARRNAARRVEAGDPEVVLHHGDVADCLPGLDGALDLVISNPPYVAEGERHLPEPEVVDHDPEIALFAGVDGLDVVRLVERAARRLLRPGGLVVVEHSDRQGRTAPALFRDAGGWAEVADHQDLLGRDRFVTARWEPAA